jgi:hypothetical protein
MDDALCPPLLLSRSEGKCCIRPLPPLHEFQITRDRVPVVRREPGFAKDWVDVRWPPTRLPALAVGRRIHEIRIHPPFRLPRRCWLGDRKQVALVAWQPVAHPLVSLAIFSGVPPLQLALLVLDPQLPKPRLKPPALNAPLQPVRPRTRPTPRTRHRRRG